MSEHERMDGVLELVVYQSTVSEHIVLISQEESRHKCIWCVLIHAMDPFPVIQCGFH